MTQEFQLSESGLLPVNRKRLIKQLADSTIVNVFDAVVELVTNSDDSYLKLEQDGRAITGRIDIYLTRGSHGQCKELIVSDEASGMGYSDLKRAIEFSGETSGFKEGRGVRGFFGRGLKESIIALGKGEILTLKNNVLCRAEISYSTEKKDAEFNLYDPVGDKTKEELLELGFSGDAGTVVKVTVTNEKKGYLPAKKTLPGQLSCHFALRGILSSAKRTAYLHVEDLDRDDKLRYDLPIKYIPTEGNIIFEEDISINEAGEVVHYKISESNEQLESPKNFYGRGGLLIRTENAILENQLFGFETDPNGLYFFGEIICPGIAKAIRAGDESIVNLNRGGLDWRHEFGKSLEKKSRDILDELIKKRKEKNKANKEIKIDEPLEKMLDKLCRALGDLAKDELEEPEPTPGDIKSFMIRPVAANIEPNVFKTFSVYVPEYLADQEGTKLVNITSSNSNIIVSEESISLQRHKKYSGILKSTFKVLGDGEGEISTITATLGSKTASAEVRVGPQKKGKKRKKLSAGGGGIFTRVIPAIDDNPIQRFNHKPGGIIEIYVKFPGVDKYLSEDLSGAYTPEGKMMLGEILIEAFCRYVARKRSGAASSEIDQHMSEIDRLRKKCSAKVYEVIFNSDLENILA